ncbi:MAG: type II secretion system major pseudopilin GspG [Gammaproteobacteria bacterium]
MMNHPYRRNSGFTLIEVMIVVVILAILAAIIVPNVMSAPGKARDTRARADIQGIVSALNMYKLDNYSYPTTEQGLKALVEKPSVEPVPHNWHQYLTKVPMDPWGKPYHYVYPGSHGEAFDIWTDGPPGSQSNKQIGNWNLDENNSNSNSNSNNGGNSNG